MKLKTKLLDLSSGGPLIAILNREDAQALDAFASDRIGLKNNKSRVTVAVDIAYGKKEIKPGEIGLFSEVQREFKVKNNQLINIKIEKKPDSLAYIRKKLDGYELKKEEIDAIVKDIVQNKLTEIESTYFISGCYKSGMSLDEVAYLTKAIVYYGGKMRFKHYPILDKHCVSGIPGNRTTMLITPIIAAAGFTMPKTSSRSITSSSGTADTMEVLAPVSHPRKKIKEIVKETNACMVWGGTLELASADDKLLKLEKVLSLDAEGILLASILSKKSAVNSSHVLIDIPVGPEAKIKTSRKAKSLAKKFVKIGKKLNIYIKVIMTDGCQPIGNGIGPALEARDILLVLQNKGPKDLKDKALYMSTLLLKMVNINNAYKKAAEILESGLAYKKMQEIIKAQGGNPNIQPEQIPLGKLSHSIKAKNPGTVQYISNSLITRIAKLAGAPTDKGAGVYIHIKLKDKVRQNQTLFTIYAENIERLNHALRTAMKNDIVKIKNLA